MTRFLKLGTQFSVLVALLSLAGCAAIGAVAYKVAPIDKTPARYTPAKELAVIVVENSKNPGENEIDSEQLARLIADQLRDNNVVPLVDDNTVINIRDRDPKKFLKMSLADLGKAAGAKQIFYVDLRQLSVDPAVGDQMVKGSLECQVRVIDVATGQNRWPADAAAGWPIAVETPLREVNDKLNESAIRRRMEEGVAVRIGHLFYDWLPDDDSVGD